MGWPEAAAPPERLTGSEFERVRRLAHERFGLDLRNGKEELVAARLSKKLREQRFHSYGEYIRHVEQDSSGEALIGLIDALTTNHTSFLREPAHFDFLRKTMLREFQDQPQLRFWSAACSTGEEPFSLALTILEQLGPQARDQVRILATDISTRALEAARCGGFSKDRMEGLPAEWRQRYFSRRAGPAGPEFQVRPEIMRMFEFRRLNLVEPMPPLGPFAVIFCRNVMIYFDRLTQQSVVNRLASCLQPGGYLFVGHAESLTGIEHPLSYVQPAIYRRAACQGGGTRRGGH